MYWHQFLPLDRSSAYTRTPNGRRSRSLKWSNARRRATRPWPTSTWSTRSAIWRPFATPAVARNGRVRRYRTRTRAATVCYRCGARRSRSRHSPIALRGMWQLLWILGSGRGQVTVLDLKPKGGEFDTNSWRGSLLEHRHFKLPPICLSVFYYRLKLLLSVYLHLLIICHANHWSSTWNRCIVVEKSILKPPTLSYGHVACMLLIFSKLNIPIVALVLKQLCKYCLIYLHFSEGITTLFDVYMLLSLFICRCVLDCVWRVVVSLYYLPCLLRPPGTTRTYRSVQARVTPATRTLCTTSSIWYSSLPRRSRSARTAGVEGDRATSTCCRTCVTWRSMSSTRTYGFRGLPYLCHMAYNYVIVSMIVLNTYVWV